MTGTCTQIAAKFTIKHIHNSRQCLASLPALQILPQIRISQLRGLNLANPDVRLSYADILLQTSRTAEGMPKSGRNPLKISLGIT